MTTVPLPDVPCVRCRMVYTLADGTLAGSRFYLSYSGSAPSGANCTTLAGDINSAWGSHILGLVNVDVSLTEVDVLDIATDSGLSGQNTTLVTGTRSGTAMPIQTAMDVEFGIARRYRGGKPRMYWPPGVTSDIDTTSMWSSAFVSSWTTDVEAFFSEIEGLSIGSMGTLQHVNLSYYQGFQNFTTPSGRERAVPKYRTTALHDNITGYFPKQLMGSQRRRRQATTP